MPLLSTEGNRYTPINEDNFYQFNGDLGNFFNNPLARASLNSASSSRHPGNIYHGSSQRQEVNDNVADMFKMDRMDLFDLDLF